ncbi:f-box domain protein [Fusarium tjaetaba]|uniref:F-box domain protein n=1 Tax=Fusarium tjaetaba TaxID=1567544 RepID=A0A8H5S655_9HYPO|nr:f-box domain protein [Fusarium tjaetaba]KAF5645224.1 f-box domain protein [Fusarium tjaetaba]
MSTNSSSHSLLGLPVDVLMCILDHAELCDLYWLSQTCKSMHRLAKRDFRTIVNNANAEDKAKFLLGLAYVLPDHFFCRNSCMLHTVDSRSPLRMSCHCQDYSVNHRRICEANFELRHQDVQMALKYNRLGGSYRDALAPLMRTHYETLYRRSLGPIIHSSATPEIKNGHFLLHEKWKLQASLTQSLNLNRVRSNVYIPICSHILILGRRPSVDPTAKISGTVWGLARLAPPPGNLEVGRIYAPRGSCQTCSTSYDFSVSEANGVVLNTTHDYGSFNSLDEWKRRSLETPVIWATTTLDFAFAENDTGEFEEVVLEDRPMLWF